MNYTIISNTCVGSLTYQRTDSLYLTPFVGSIILDDRFYIELARNFYDYFPLDIRAEHSFATQINSPIVDFVDYENDEWHRETGLFRFQSINPWDGVPVEYPIMRLWNQTKSDYIPIHWIHHTDKDKIKEKFIERSTRMFQPIIFIWSKTERFTLKHNPDPIRTMIETMDRRNHLIVISDEDPEYSQARKSYPLPENVLWIVSEMVKKQLREPRININNVNEHSDQGALAMLCVDLIKSRGIYR